MTLPARCPGLALARLLAQGGRTAEALAVIAAALDRVPEGNTTVRARLMHERQLLTAAGDQHTNGTDT